MHIRRSLIAVLVCVCAIVTAQCGGASTEAPTPPPSPPTLTSIGQGSGVAGQSSSRTLTGTNFVAGATVSVSGAGVTVSNVNVASATSLSATFAFATGVAPLGDHTVTVRTAGGTSGGLPLTVVPAAPTVTSIAPNTAPAGTIANVTISGTNFIAPNACAASVCANGTTVGISGTGVTVNSVNVMNENSVTAVLVIGANATLGEHTITLTTSGGSTTTQFSTNNSAVRSVVVTPASSIVVGDTRTMAAEAFDEAGQPIPGLMFTWTADDPAIATVGATSGVVTGALPGTARIRATVDGISGSTSIGVTAPVLTSQGVTGLTGGIHVHVETTSYSPAYSSGFSYYSSIATLNPELSAKTQFGWGVWITPNNRDITVPGNLCPAGRPSYQSLEGGAGTWGNTKFPMTIPKFLVVATGDCYQQGVAGLGYNNAKPIPEPKLGLAQISNRLLLPPDNITFVPPNGQAFFGYGWISLPIIPPSTSPLGIATGDQNWTLFLNTANFKGPLVFWVPEYWTSIDAIYPAGIGRGLDSRSALTDGMGLEIGHTTAFTAVGPDGVTYKRVPKMTFPVVGQRATMVQDARYYNQSAISNAFGDWVSGGAAPTAMSGSGILNPPAAAQPVPNWRMSTGGNVAMDPGTLTVVNPPNGPGLGFEWGSGWEPGVIPEYWKQEGTTWKAIHVSEVPRTTWLMDQEFPKVTATGGFPRLDVSAGSIWTSDRWAAGPFMTPLGDGSTVEYVWYRFVDQPAIRRLNLPQTVLDRLQTWIEDLHSRWGTSGVTIPGPTSGTLVTIDPGSFVTPPAGLERGYVPVAIGQY